LPNFLELASGEAVTALQALPTKSDSAKFLVMATRGGLIKKTAREDFANIRRSGLKAITLKGSDTLEWVGTSTGADHVLLASSSGQAIHFSEKEVRPMGRTAAGVRAMRLKGGDQVVAMHVVPKDAVAASQVLVITERGYGKRTALKEYRLQGRGGSGIKTANVTAKTGSVINAAIVSKDTVKATDLLVVSERGQVIRIAADTVSLLSRATQGVKVMSPSAQSGNVAAFTTWANEQSLPGE
jgi:DNA gyrase subunit A